MTNRLEKDLESLLNYEPVSTKPFDVNENPERIYTIDDAHRLIIRKGSDGRFTLIPESRFWFEEPQFEYHTFDRLEDADDYAAVVVVPSRRKAYGNNGE